MTLLFGRVQRAFLIGSALLLSSSIFSQSSNSTWTNGNRLVYLDESDPFYPGLKFPKLTTPQWIGEPGVDAAVILAIDDMREPAKYEAHIRPILDRLKQIDGRAAFSIMTIAIKADDPQLQPWLKEGVSLEVHTLTHPFPLLGKSNFHAAAETYFGCIDLLNKIPGNKPVAFRMPYCDSLDTPSPRFYAELFNSTNSAGQFLSIDSSVMNILTSADPELPRGLVTEANGKERFRKYIPFPSFVTTIENYPYPYVIGKLCWEFPAMVPSDWEAKNFHGTNNPVTIADWEAALDATVLKQGAFTFIFHPHGWIRADQMVEFIDYAVGKYGKRVKFLNFREALDRINTHLLAGSSLRSSTGHDNGVRLVDLNNDGYLDVLIGNSTPRRTRIWQPQTRTWQDSNLPLTFVQSGANREQLDAGVRFGIVGPEHQVAMVSLSPRERAGVRGNGASELRSAYIFSKDSWIAETNLLRGLQLNGEPLATAVDGRDRGVRFRDLDNDGQTELIVGNEAQSAVFKWFPTEETWKQQPFGLPAGASIVDSAGRDAGLRFVDLNQDGYADVIFSNDRRYSIHLFRAKADPRLNWTAGWTDQVISQNRTDTDLIPMISRGGPHANNGAWFHSGTMWVQNEQTSGMPDLVDRRSYRQLLTCDQPQPQSPQKSLASIKVHPGFKVELVASEPLVQDPIAFDWGADGKLWVVEMGDYPLGIDNKGKPGGRVRFLEDTDGDGRYDKSTVFLEGLNFPNGIIPWRKGVIVSAAPEIFYAEDNDGDGKADIRKTLFTGFVEGNQQHRANGFEYGLDNWLYGANGDSGGDVRSVNALVGNTKTFAPIPKQDPRHPPRTLFAQGGATPSSGQHGPVNLRGHDFRIQPDQGLIETVAGQTQYGRHRNDWGDWFGNNNPTWLWHYYLAEEYLVRNPNLAVRNTKRMLANYPDSTRAFPASRTLQRFNDPAAANHVTSGNSPTPYRDELFGPEFASSVFISEPVHNLVHREVLERDGVSFKSTRAKEEQQSEFLASTDNWFRPTMLKTGPDGALYLTDMYRLVIEHPEWIPPQMQARLDLRAGSDMGRIYRVYPEDATLRKIPRLDKLGTVELVAALDSPNGWQRDTAQRLLLHARDPKAVAPLKQLVSARRPQTRLQSLATLQGLNAVTAAELAKALRDSHPMVRRFALQVSEPFLREGKTSGIGQAILALVNDPELPVRYQLAFTLGEWHATAAAQALLQLADRDSGNADMLTAILSSAEPHAKTMLALLLDSKRSNDPPPILGALLTSTSIAADHDAVAKAMDALAQPRSGQFLPWQYRAFAGLLAGLERQGKAWTEFFDSREAVKMEPIFNAARSAATNTAATISDRLAAVGVLGRTPSTAKADLPLLGNLLSPQHPTQLQEAALEGLKRSRDESVATILISNWRTLGPGPRQQVLGLLQSRSEWAQQLLDAIESNRIAAGEIGIAAQQKLITSRDAAVSSRAEKMFAAIRSDRRALVRQYATELPANGDASKGAVLFKQNCAVCHRLHGEGVEIGPDLAMVTGKPTEVLLEAVLDPNAAVEARYLSYNVTTRNGRDLTGLISAETPTSITLRSQGGVEEVLLRSDITEMRSSGLSLMPEGLEKAFKPQDMADLLAFVRQK